MEMQSDQVAGKTQPETTGNTSLDPEDWGSFRAQAHRMLDDMLGFVEGLRERPLWQVIPQESRSHFREELPTGPAPLAQVHQEFLEHILPFGCGNAHPGFMGWVQGGGTPVGMLAEMLAAGLNANVGGRDQIPLEVERQVTQWMRSLFGFPAASSGLFLSGTSMANLVAVKVARDARLGADVRRSGNPADARLVAYTSAAAHGSLARAFDLVGLGSDCLRIVPVDDRHRMRLDALAHAVEKDRAAGFVPFLVAASAGTVDTGAIDDLAGIADFCHPQQLWFHIDGAFGALAILSPELKPRLQGIERADSLAFDFHKWAQVPYDAGFLLVRNSGLHQQAFSSTAAYLTREDRGLAAGSPWPCDFGPELSRGFRALKTWMTLKVYGTEAIGAVIDRCCALAGYLERRISEHPELELLAPVELNIVCFRYRPAAGGEELADRLNRQIVIALQEAGAVAPSTTQLGGRMAIRAAIVNHRTTRADIDTLLEAVLGAGHALEPAATPPTHSDPDPDHEQEPKWQPWLDRSARLQEIDAILAEPDLEKPLEVSLRFERASLLAELGQRLDARSEHLKLLQLEPSHLGNFIRLGRLLSADGLRKAAQLVYAEGIKHHPRSMALRVNLGGVLLEAEEPAQALVHFEAALRLNPDQPQAHAGMFYALSRLGKPEAAAQHQAQGFRHKNFFTKPYRGDAQPIPVLLFVSSTGGNTPSESLIDDQVFQTYVVVTDFYDRSVPLPPHQLVINGIGDVEVSRRALEAAEALLAQTSAPVLNPPAAVLATGRTENAARLRGIPGLITARTGLFPHAALAGPEVSGADAAALLEQQGFRFPLLLRVPGFHMGQHFVQVDSLDALPAAFADLPDGGRNDAELLAIEYLDARGADGCHRKYRVMMVDGQLFPLHLAISENWKVHYFSADMADRPDHRAEEERFLSDMAGVLGPTAMHALRTLQKTLGLDYAGIDFGLNAHGDILLFETNATMVVAQPAAGDHWDYRRPAVDRILAALAQMFLRTAAARAKAEVEQVNFGGM